MTRNQARKLIEFIRRHYDYVSQEDYFAFCDLVLDAVVHDANQQRFADKLAMEYPDMFESVAS